MVSLRYHKDGCWHLFDPPGFWTLPSLYNFQIKRPTYYIPSPGGDAKKVSFRSWCHTEILFFFLLCVPLSLTAGSTYTIILPFPNFLAPFKRENFRSGCYYLLPLCHHHENASISNIITTASFASVPKSSSSLVLFSLLRIADAIIHQNWFCRFGTKSIKRIDKIDGRISVLWLHSADIQHLYV